MILILILILGVSLSSGLEIKDCGSKGKDIQLRISSCSESDISCPLIHGTDVTLEADFTVNKKTSNVKIELYGTVGFFPIAVPFYLGKDKDQVCSEHYDVNCPLKPETKQTVKITLPINNLYPTVNVKIRVKLVDHENDKESIICKEFPAKISMT